MKKTSVMLVDDHAVVRMGLAALIGTTKDLVVCGDAESGEDAVKLAGRLKPDVVIMDLAMPGMRGAEATAAVLKASPSSKVLILTTFGTAAELSEAVMAGATGAITKNIPSSELAKAIRDTSAGIRHFSPEIKISLQECAEPQFTQRQRNVIDLIVRGLSNNDIADLLGISKARVKQHLNEIYRKLGAANRAEAVAIAMSRQLPDSCCTNFAANARTDIQGESATS